MSMTMMRSPWVRFPMFTVILAVGIWLPLLGESQDRDEKIDKCFELTVGPWQIDGDLVTNPPIGHLPERIWLTPMVVRERDDGHRDLLIRPAPGFAEGDFDDATWRSSGNRLVLRWATVFHGIVADVKENYERVDGRMRLSGEVFAWGDDLAMKRPRAIMTLTPVDCF